MRDPRRITGTLRIFERLWNRHPDLRFQQIVDLINTEIIFSGKDPHYIEEEKLNEIIIKLINKTY